MPNFNIDEKQFNEAAREIFNFILSKASNICEIEDNKSIGIAIFTLLSLVTASIFENIIETGKNKEIRKNELIKDFIGMIELLINKH